MIIFFFALTAVAIYAAMAWQCYCLSIDTKLLGETLTRKNSNPSTATLVFEFREVEFYGGPLDGKCDVHPILNGQCTVLFKDDEHNTVSRYVYDGDRMVFTGQREL